MMEKKPHPDRLEKYLQKSFENHSESPPDNLWGRIEGNLPVPAPAAAIGSLAKLLPWAAAAAVSGVLIFQQLAHTRQLDDLQSQLAQQTTALVTLAERQSTTEGQLAKALEAIAQTENLTGLEQVENDPKVVGSASFSPEKKLSENIVPPESAPSGISQITENQDVATSGPTAGEVAAPFGAEVAEPSKGTAAAPAPRFPIPLEPFLSGAAKRPFPLPTGPPDEPRPRGLRSISIGLQVGRMQTRSTITSLLPRPWQWGTAPNFDDEISSTGTLSTAGVSVRAELRNGWYFQTGASHRRMALQSSHAPDFWVKTESQGQPKLEHELHYLLNTATGLVDFNIRAEQQDPDAQVGIYEQLNLTVTTDQSLRYLGVPLLIGRQLGRGRAHLNLSGGVIANFLLDSSVATTSATLDNEKFRLASNGWTLGRETALRSFGLDYQLGVGFAYDLSPVLSFELMPSITGSLSSRHYDPYTKSGDFSAGLELGIRYHFLLR